LGERVLTGGEGVDIMGHMEKQSTTYTIKEIADMLKVSTKTVLRWLNSGDLKGQKYGHQWRVWAEDFEEYLGRDKD
jgi:excisionase family DNA binding protein